jgi:hypothetical protein
MMKFEPGNLYRIKIDATMYTSSPRQRRVKVKTGSVLVFLYDYSLDYSRVKTFLFNNQIIEDSTGTIAYPESYFEKLETSE